MRLTHPFRILSVVLLLQAAPVRAQDGLLAPAEFLGYELGTRFTPYHRVVDYLEHAAARSPNVRLERYGETYEGRPLLAAFVSSPENAARLEDIRRDNLRRAGVAAGEAVEDAPAVVWLSYNVHGNEAASTEAAMATLYALADPGNARTQPWLAHTVVVIDPCLNPDGRARYVQWYRQTVGRTPDPARESREHHEPWPGGRTNHYYFDLNRDWAWGTQQETRYRLALYNRWLPHVHVDFHEQGVDEPYYFAPAAEPLHEDVTPWQQSFQATVGRNHARYFDAAGWLYFTRQRFDLLYPGYGDTWPTFNGAVGMTYEQGGSGRAGQAVRTAEGDTLTLADRIAHHHATGLSTVEATARDRAEVVDAFARFYRDARQAPSGDAATYVVKTAGRPDARSALAAHLDRQGLAYGYAAREHRANGFRYRTGDVGPVTVAPGDLVVPAAQAKGVLAKVLFEPRAALSDSLTYDVTAWSLPYVYGLDAAALETRLDPDAAAAPAGEDLTGAPDRPYAYLARWRSPEDVRFLAALLREGVRVRFAARPFEIDGRRYGRGTLIVTRAGNERPGTAFDDTVRRTARTHAQPLHAVATGLVTTGPDFGSHDVRFLGRPRVAVLSGEGVRPGALGEVWHFFDRRIDYPATLIDAETLDVAALYDYDVVVLPSGSYAGVLDDDEVEALANWIRSGGRLVAMEDAVAFLADKEGFVVAKKPAKQATGDSLEARLQPYGDRARRSVADEVPGSIYRVALDPTHPLGFGYPDVYFTLKRDDDAFAFLEDGWNVGVVRRAAPESGFAGHASRRQLEDSLVFGVQEMGRGTVVYLVDDPLFRGFWYGGQLLFANAVFMAGR